VGAIQIEIVEPLNAAIIEIDVHHRVVVGRTQELQGVTEDEKLVYGLGIPRLKDVGEQPETQMCCDPDAPQEDPGL
jgi:hypothetical protein